MRNLLRLGGLSLVLLACPARAEGVGFGELKPLQLGLMFDLGYGTINADQATAQRIGDSGFSPTVTLNADVFQVLTLAASAGTIFVDDHAGFEQDVVNNQGDESTAESTLNLNNLGLSAGLRSPALVLAETDEYGNYPATWLFARYGHSWQSASRSVHMCIDCDSEDVELGNGGYIDAGALIGIFYGRGALGVVVGASYKRYLADSAIKYIFSGTIGMTLL